jgi:hypothetical protein
VAEEALPITTTTTHGTVEGFIATFRWVAGEAYPFVTLADGADVADPSDTVLARVAIILRHAKHTPADQWQ